MAVREMKTLPHWIIFLCLVGMLLSIELTRIHVFVHTDPSYHSVCAMSEGINCETVAISPYAVFAGIPVSIWGIVGYFFMGMLALWGRTQRRLHPSWPFGFLLLLSAFSLTTSAVLGYISATQIDSLCIFCLGSYAVNLALFVLTLVAWRRSSVSLRGLLAGDIKAFVGKPALAAVLVISGMVVIVALKWFLPTYWTMPGWSDLPKLPSGVDSQGHHWMGAKDTTWTLVEFSDYECPHCRAAHKAIRILAAKYPDKIRLVHRHLPLDQACLPSLHRPFHRHACRFAEAAECAGLQGRFWEMNDALFSTQETVKADTVDPVDLAVRLGLHRLEFERCLNSHATAERIDIDVRESQARNLTGTPSFLLGNRLFLGRIPEAELVRWISTRPEGPSQDESK